MPFVGRIHELGLLHERWDQAKAAQGQLALITGEPGIGKSRLVEAFCETLTADGQQLIRLQCSPFLTDSAYHPFVERLARVAGIGPSDSAANRLRKLEELLRETDEDLQSLIPVYAELLSIPLDNNYQPLDVGPQTLKELTLKTLDDRVARIAARGPTVVVLEDAHWIDPSTQEVFERVVPRIQSLPVLLIITHRPGWPADWAAAYSHCTTIAINRIGRDQIAQLVKAVAGIDKNDNMVDKIAARTDGVPLYVVELARAMAEASPTNESNREQHIPETLQGSLMSRLDRLNVDAKSIAQIASVIGRDFDKELLAKVAKRDSQELQASLEQLQAAQILTRSALDPDGFTFRHALIQDAAYHSLLSSRRRAYHDILAETLVADYPDTAHARPELIARHFSEAERWSDAYPFWKRAAERALGRSANLEAVSHAQNALKGVHRLDNPKASQAEIIDATFLHATALSLAGRLAAAMLGFQEAAGLAHEAGLGTVMAEAALGYDNALFLSNERDRTSIDIISQTLEILPKDEHRFRCQLAGRLARAHLLLAEYEEAQRYNEEAMEQARTLNEMNVIFDVLINQFLMSTSGRTEAESARVRDDVDEMVAIARSLDDKDALGRAYCLDAYFSSEIAVRDQFDGALDALIDYGEANEMPHLIWISRHGRAMQALLDGDFANAERFAEEALEMGQQTHGDGVEGVYGIQMFSVRREQGRLAEVAPIIKRLIDDNPGDAAWKPGFALIASELGYAEPAQRMLNELADIDFTFPLDAKHSTTLSYLAEVCAALEDERHAEVLYELLKPYEDMTITAGVMTVCLGSANRFLGQLASTLGDWSLAERHFSAAISMDHRMRARPWLAHTQHRYASMLRRRNRQGDIELAHDLLEQSMTTANDLNMVLLKSQLHSHIH